MLLGSDKSLVKYYLSQKPFLEIVRSELDETSKELQPVLLSLLEAAYNEVEDFSLKLEARNLSHSRRVKVDKMKEIMANESPIPSSSSMIPEPVGALPSPSINIPYPHFSSCNPHLHYTAYLNDDPFMPAYSPIPLSTSKKC
ncbi:unnamed protein product [Lepeophtheirus salmonis]|uniref:(salmon louse) hypothetical protein n=1 Tax=Lepeophtheirus salmonis TaxID=72036 RepID=A0A7R8H1B4_LEPSM|nr:unnamed protein product [Lepeophtheirus salmonis]CAF2806250.1 unnamed protein product [Lepeophtheirus salmonis]